MRLYVYFLSFLLVISSFFSSSYAFAPVVGAVASVGGRVAVKTATGAVIKKLANGAIEGFAHGAVALCITGQISFSFCQKLKKSMSDDGISFSGSGAGGDWNIEIYRQQSVENQQCGFKYLYSGVVSQCYYNSDMTVKYYGSYTTAYSCNASINVQENKIFSYSGFETTNASKKDAELKKYVSENRDKLLSEMKVNEIRGFGLSEDKHHYRHQLHKYESYSSVYARFYYQKVCGSDFSGNKIYLTQQEINNYFNNSITNADITNIYNYDFSQYNNITINGMSDNANKTMSGNEINNSKNSFDPNFGIDLGFDAGGLNITNDLFDKIKIGDLDIDSVNNDNCTKNGEGEYYRCGNQSDDESSDNSNSDDTTTGTDNNEGGSNDNSDDTTNDDENKTCNSNAFYRKVCDWIDWTQKDSSSSSDSKVLVEDLSEQLKIDRNRVNFAEQCPPAKQISLSVMGFTNNIELSYEPICDFFIKLKPFLISVSLLSAVLIIGGRRG